MSGETAVCEFALAAAEPECSVHEAPLSGFVERELERLYGNVFASLVHVRSLGLLPQAQACVISRAGKVTAVLLFHREGRIVRVLNTACAMRPADVERCARTIFAACPDTSVIAFPALSSPVTRLPYPFQRFDCLEDIVLELPSSAETYFAALGRNMRSSLKRYQKKINTDFPGFRYGFYEGQDVSEQDVAAIVALSSARIASKNRASSHSAEKTRQLINLVKECGVVLVARIDGRVCAGVICTEYGGNFFMHVVAHDPAYDDYRIGKVCCYLSICEAIRRGGAEYHFLWGRYEYKYRLLGEQRDFDRLVIYRSPLAVLLNLHVFLQTLWRGHGRRFKWWLLDDARKDSRWGRLLLGAWQRFGKKA